MAGSFFTTGRDGALVIRHPLALAGGGEITLPLLTSFDAKPNFTTLSTQLISGEHLKDYLPQNWDITITADRGNAVLDDFQAQLDLAKRRAIAVPTGSIFQYINELDGSQTTFQFIRVTFQLTEAGRYSGDDIVRQTLMASATRRSRV